ncbi:hypothetical protein E3N88_28729 [Mikania micrantha]|uniref:Transmembrane 9 superfamily member n=1 Tax=Mikania micrantha TaxID=192012 RepID=A0A5N6N0L6_9ASTR|nr:hypothetical protein E3N88_28729 [Mikania micrantha]
MDFFDKFKIWVVLICSISQLGYGFYLPGSYPHKYVVGDPLSVKVNSLTSIDTEIPYSYYSLPFCQPPEGVKDSRENLGELLMGDRIENSPYKFKMYTNETEIFLCQTKPLSSDEYKLLTNRIDEIYQVNLILDNLPAIRYIKRDSYYVRWTGYPIGIKVEDVYYVFNHLKFTVLVHKYEETNVASVMGTGDAAEMIPSVKKSGPDVPGYMVVGFEVTPCSVRHNPESLKNLKETYTKYPSKIACEDNMVTMAIKENEPVAFTYEILGMAIVTIMFAALGFMSPASRGTLVTGMLIFYMVLGVLAGYVAVRMWRTIFCGDHRGWVSVSWQVACFFPGIAFLVLFTLNFLLWGSQSTGAIPFFLFVILILLWFCISVPLTFVGGYFGAKAPHIEYPVRTNQIPREIPPQKYPSWLLVLGAGTLPFGTLFIELFFIMSSIWMGRVYYVFGFLFVVLILLVVVCAEVSLVLTYMHLCVEDWKWWWKSFFASGSVALYIFLYSINYLVFDLKSLSGPVSATLYMGYSFLMVLTIMLATGTVGFLSSFWFVHYLFSSVKLD